MKKIDITNIETKLESKKAELAKLEAEYSEVSEMKSSELKLNHFCSPGFNPSGFDIQTSLQDFMSSKTYILSTLENEIKKLKKQIAKLEEKLAELQPIA